MILKRQTIDRRRDFRAVYFQGRGLQINLREIDIFWVFPIFVNQAITTIGDFHLGSGQQKMFIGRWFWRPRIEGCNKFIQIRHFFLFVGFHVEINSIQGNVTKYQIDIQELVPVQNTGFNPVGINQGILVMIQNQDFFELHASKNSQGNLLHIDVDFVSFVECIGRIIPNPGLDKRQCKRNTKYQ